MVGQDIYCRTCGGINNISAHHSKHQALRYNEGKAQYSLIDLQCFEYTAKVLEFGARKYTRDNWRKGMNTSSILDSLLRHIAALLSGEVVDLESGLPHLGHIGCNVMFLGNKNNIQDIKVLPDISSINSVDNSV